LATPCAVLSSSAHCAKSFEPIGVQRAIEVVYVGVDLERFADDGTLRHAHRAKLGVGDDTVVVLFMGRFNSLMGLDAIIELIPQLTVASDKLKIVLAGARGDLSPMAVACAEAHPDHVVVANDLPFAMLPALYAAADIVLAPSRDQHACMGVSIKEAMAASRAVIGSDSGGIPEAIDHGTTGLVVALNQDGSVDHQAFAAAILTLAGDREKRTEMGRRARQRAELLFSEQVTAARTMNVMRRCLPRE
jgi:glycosyltransferase involved in cell wall biosynthesis